ncbi:23S rRNA (cytosine1962-C5)-methyltransferase [Malonomonas rubra DSM 5091]|uniref:23S rRNA (Cytosine1962-C5)-methyltransferase n=1 Tax=Malonomonas rubra DSM 5091 TaxID=1122189 RepID=A0A1M6BAN8_MALRU|nr:class I SAM-dependent methyltransferase [Malonomonas rubra]SHI45820.1 23S rRNA (cytosine1962-C5)-methyltransferase [Malonomonas rubra DSM 5091]
MKCVFQEIEGRLPLSTESKRLFHGRGHCFPGYEDILIDWFAPVVLITLYSPRDQSELGQLSRYLQQQISRLEAVLVQQRYQPDSPVACLAGNPPDSVDAVEDGRHFRLRLGQAQNIGFFPDMGVGRNLIAGLAPGKRVLNLFAYSCSFSVAALTAGAEEVVNVDMNRGALELGRLNHRLNDIDLRKASFLPLEVFRSFKKLSSLGPFDLVICDPPAYQGKSFKAERDWPKLLRKLPSLLAGSADVLACLNGPHLSPDFLQAMFDELLPQMMLIAKFQPGEDFPEAEEHRGVWGFHYRRSG